jgi:hypothetical protein
MPYTSAGDYARGMQQEFRRFRDGLRRHTEKMPKEKMVLFHKKLVFDIFGRIIDKTPVDTGRARNNWQMVIGENPGDVVEDTSDKTGNAAKEKGYSNCAGLAFGDNVTIYNNLPYIVPLEEGHSSQTDPHVMVRGSLHEVLGGYGG